MLEGPGAQMSLLHTHLPPQIHTSTQIQAIEISPEVVLASGCVRLCVFVWRRSVVFVLSGCTSIQIASLKKKKEKKKSSGGHSEPSFSAQHCSTRHKQTEPTLLEAAHPYQYISHAIKMRMMTVAWQQQSHARTKKNHHIIWIKHQVCVPDPLSLTGNL